MECLVCFNDHNDTNYCPMILECGHTLCYTCTKSIYSKFSPKCPFDRNPLTQRLQNLKQNFALLELINDYQSLKQIEINRSLLNSQDEEQGSSLVCSSGHHLKNLRKSKEKNLFFGKAINSLIVCRHCGISALNFSYSCGKCDFDLCERCLTEQLYSKQVVISDQVRKCPSNHLIFNYYDFDKFSLRKSSQILKLECIFCLRLLDKTANACKICSFHVCDDCCKDNWNEKIEELKNSGIKKYCLKGHELQLNSENSEETSTKICSHCKSSGFADFASCEICLFFLCKDCYESSSQPREEADKIEWVCSQRHPLSYYTDSVEFYKRKFQRFQNIVCHACSNNFLGPSWSCRVCSYDLCLNCKPKTKKDLGWCNMNHPLKVINLAYSNQGFTCSICKLYSNDSGVWCEWCRFAICASCKEYFNRSEYLHVTCIQGHALVYSKDQLDLYEVRYSSRKFQCNGCKAHVETISNYHCRRCEFDLCDTCYGTILLGAYQGISAYCFYGHQLSWSFNTTAKYNYSYYCSSCGMEYESCGSFNCSECIYDVCIRCAYVLVNRVS